jgi:hypothetical protein
MICPTVILMTFRLVKQVDLFHSLVLGQHRPSTPIHRELLKLGIAIGQTNRFAFAAYFPAPSLRMFASPGCDQIVIGIGHRGSRLVGRFGMILSLQANDLRPSPR